MKTIVGLASIIGAAAATKLDTVGHFTEAGAKTIPGAYIYEFEDGYVSRLS